MVYAFFWVVYKSCGAFLGFYSVYVGYIGV